jgi:hypothetical protein
MALRAVESLLLVALCAEWLMTMAEHKSFGGWRRKR